MVAVLVSVRPSVKVAFVLPSRNWRVRLSRAHRHASGGAAFTARYRLPALNFTRPPKRMQWQEPSGIFAARAPNGGQGRRAGGDGRPAMHGNDLERSDDDRLTSEPYRPGQR